MSTTEAAVVRAVVRELDARSIVSWNVGPANGETGLPDRMAVLPGGRLLAIECKRPDGGRVSPKQRWWLKRLRDAGALALVVSDVRELRSALDEIDREETAA
jgi:hypothetical protein